MRKTWMIFLSILLCTALMGCGTKEDKDTVNNSESNKPIEENTDETANDKVNLELADKASEKISEIEEVESATVILTDNNAYVGVVLNKKADGTEIKEGSEELDELYAKIRKELSMTNANVKNVYISINPEFVTRMQDYGKKIEEGKPVEGLFEEFSETVKRVFPDAK